MKSKPRRRFPAVPAVLATVALFAAVNGVPATGKSVRLRYGLKPSSSYDQQGSIALKLAIDPSTLPQGLAALVMGSLSDARQEIQIKGRLEVQSQAADGTIPFTYRVTDAQGTLARGSETKPLTGVSAMVGRPPVEARFSADRRRIEFPPAPETGETRHDRARDQLAQSLPDLPEGELKVGDSFEARVPVVLPGAGGRAEDRVEARWIYTLRSIEANRARFDVRQVLPNATATATKGRTYTVAGGAVGKATFDTAEGLFTDINLDADMSMTVTVPTPPGLAAPGGQPGSGAAAPGGAPAPITLASKVTGPIAVSMSRAAAP
jgi:hypothetical protein